MNDKIKAALNVIDLQLIVIRDSVRAAQYEDEDTLSIMDGVKGMLLSSRDTRKIMTDIASYGKNMNNINRKSRRPAPVL